MSEVHASITEDLPGLISLDASEPSGESGSIGPNGKWEPTYWQELSSWLDGAGPSSRLSWRDAIRISAVMICLDVLSQDVSKCALRMVERLPNGGKRIVEPDEHWLAELLATEPNSKHTWFEFMQMLVLHLGLVNNSFIAKRMTRPGIVKELIPIAPNRVSIEVNSDQTGYVYWVSTATNSDVVMMRGFDNVLLEDEMIHLRTRMFDGLYGMSTLAVGGDAFNLADAVNEFQTRLYASDAQTRGVFQAKDKLNEEAWKRLKNQLGVRWSKFQKSGTPILLEEGMEFKSVSMTADQAETSKARDAAIVDICRLFRIPPHKAMHLVNVKYENLEAMEKAYAADTIFPLFLSIEQRMNRGLLSRRERARFGVEFDRAALVMADIEKQVKMVDTLAKIAGISGDEARAVFGMNPMPGDAGKARVLGSTYSLIDDKNKIILAAGAPDKSKGEAEAAAAEGDKPAADAAKAANVVSLRP